MSYSLNIYLQVLKKILKQGMLNLDDGTSDQLILLQFMSGLPLAISKQLRASGDTVELNKVVECAHLLMTIEEYEPISTVKSSNNEIRELREQVKQLTSRQTRGPGEYQKPATKRPLSLRCYNCQGIGHFQCNCPMRRYNNSRQCIICGQRGHIARNYQGNYRGMPKMGRSIPQFTLPPYCTCGNY